MNKHLRLLVALAASVALVAAACGDDDDPGQADGPTITIGAQDFGESAILAEVYEQALAAEGFTVSTQAVGGFRDLSFGAFESGDINMTLEYAASALEFLNEGAGEATGDAEETTELLNGYLVDLGLVALDPSPAVDTNAFVVKPEVAEMLEAPTMSALAAAIEDGTIEPNVGAPQDFGTNPFGAPGFEAVYGVDLSDSFTGLETGAIADALDADAVNVALLFSTSGIIADNGWVLLEDDQGMLAADNVVPVIATELDEAYGSDLTGVLNDISGQLSTEMLTEANKRFDVDKEDADDIAADIVAELDL